ncbi:hypothetical protein RKE29_12305 [Streptomyces sp. B1866]|uniref:hypothetical protein n=1 Tax=Streptomyces sp. B1866 TaxID=3075431 RepID=UPI00289119A4|nr:hypothetical protein [Streptomyces sp. B1866]MDT3397421.1 hypothetical protein [Streptomyces sp. B1866]
MIEPEAQHEPVAGAGYEAPTARLAGTLVGLAAGSYSEGQSDDGDFSTVKWQPGYAADAR